MAVPRRRASRQYHLVTPPPSPCFEHQYQNKGVSSPKYAKNIKTKDLSRMKESGQVKSCFYIFLRTSLELLDF